LKLRIIHLCGEKTATHIRLFEKLRINRCQWLTQKKAYNIQNMSEVWNQDLFTSMGRKLQDNSTIRKTPDQQTLVNHPE
jgi:hypothetical protein